LNYFSWKNY